MPAQLKHGVIGCAGGKRRNAGRKPNWYKAAADKLIHSKRLLPRLARLAAGEEVLTKTITPIDGKGKSMQILTAADGGTQVYAAEKLMDRAWGKPRQEVDVTSNAIDLTAVLAMIAQSRAERGLPNE